ncbi:MAG: hypothetical protein AAB320_06990 [Elusimicrobiota bacterium]
MLLLLASLTFPPDMAAVQAELRRMPVPVTASAAPVFDAQALWEAPIPGLDNVEARRYQAEAERLSARGLDFSSVFSGLAGHLLRSPRTASSPRQEIASLFRGLIRWTRHGAAPSFQGRADWPLHFIYGGYIAATYGNAAAEAAALAKEEKDSLTPGNTFDLDDYAVTLIGARWSVLALERPQDLPLWAAGAKALSLLPALPFGRLPQGRQPQPVLLQRVRAFVRSAL